ncbi:hypothetical protein Tco_0154417 [Tanacetum coccineum]
MNPTAANQIAIDNALVPPEARLKIGECNRRVEFSKPQREATYQVTLDALKLITKVKDSSSYQFKLDNKKFRVNAEEILRLYLNCSLITYINLGEHLQLSSIGAFPEKPLDLINLDFAFQIENHFSKESIPYPRFIKIIINHFISQNKSISMRNRINLHTTRDDSLLGTLKYVSKTEEHQVYRALIPKVMLNEDILISTAYKTYYAYIVPVSPKEPTKKPAKAKKDVPLTKKPSTKPKPTKKKAPVKADRGKGLNVLLEVALSEEARLKKISGTNKGTGTKPGVPDVPKYDSKSDKESWGDSREEDDDDEDDTEEESNNANIEDDDNDGNDDDGDNDDNDDVSDHERTESEKDENPNLNQFTKEHAKEEEEYVDEFIDEEDDADNEKRRLKKS